MHTFVAADETKTILAAAMCYRECAFCQMLHANTSFSTACSRCLRIFGFLVRSMKKFCSSLSSFRVICLQLNKICKFKAAPASHRKIVVTIKKSSKETRRKTWHSSPNANKLKSGGCVFFHRSFVPHSIRFYCNNTVESFMLVFCVRARGVHIAYLSHDICCSCAGIRGTTQRDNLPHQNTKTPNIWLDRENIIIKRLDCHPPASDEKETKEEKKRMSWEKWKRFMARHRITQSQIVLSSEQRQNEQIWDNKTKKNNHRRRHSAA